MPNFERDMDRRHAANMKTAPAVRSVVRKIPKTGAVIVVDSSNRKSFVEQILRERSADLAAACRVLIIRDAGTVPILTGLRTPVVVDPAYDAPTHVRAEVKRLAAGANVVADFDLEKAK